MRLTMQTDYALRMLIQLGVHNDRLVTVSETARAYQVSKPYDEGGASALPGRVRQNRAREWRRAPARDATLRNQCRRSGASY